MSAGSANSNHTMELSTDTAISNVKRFLDAGWFGAAQLRLVDILSAFPDDAEARAYAAWADFNLNKRDETLRADAIVQVSKAVAQQRTNAELCRILGLLLKISGRYEEAAECFHKASRLNPKDVESRHELDQMRLRQEPVGYEWPEVQLQEVDIKAPITVQTRLRSFFKVRSFNKHELRIGCARHDHLLVGDTVVPEVVKNHCTILERNGKHFVRRNGSRGRVWIDGEELPIRNERRFRSNQTVRIGGGMHGPALEIRLVNIHELHLAGAELTLRAA